MIEPSETYWSIAEAVGFPTGRAPLVLVAILVGVVAAIVTFELAKAVERVPTAIIKSGAAFAVTVTLALLVIDKLFW